MWRGGALQRQTMASLLTRRLWSLSTSLSPFRIYRTSKSGGASAGCKYPKNCALAELSLTLALTLLGTAEPPFMRAGFRKQTQWCVPAALCSINKAGISLRTSLSLFWTICSSLTRQPSSLQCTINRVSVTSQRQIRQMIGR